MSKELKLHKILDYNDVPQLFVAEDAVRTKFIALLVEDLGDKLHYISTPISSDRIAEYLSGRIDLKTVFSQPEIPEYWFSINNIDTEVIIAKRREDITILPDNFLPGEGYYYQKDLIEDKVIVKEVFELGKVIIHVAIDDGTTDNSAKAGTVGDVSFLYQSLVDHALRKTIAQSTAFNKETKRALSIPRNSELRAFATSEGSFNIHFYSISNSNLFGEHVIEMALQKLDEIISNRMSDDETIAKLRGFKGHPIKSYKKLLGRIIKDGITVKYKWYSPTSKDVHSNTITKDYATRIYDLLSQKDELTEEIKVFEGYMLGADVINGAWRVRSIDGTEYTGGSDGSLLEGITLNTVLYRLTCYEIIETQTITEAEKVKYVMQTIAEVPQS